jgi:hypothetical protein
VKVLWTNYRRSYGVRSSGGTISVRTRTEHSSISRNRVIFQNRKRFFNAKHVLQKQVGTSRPRYRYDYPSFSFVGPVLLPKTDTNTEWAKLLLLLDPGVSTQKDADTAGARMFRLRSNARATFRARWIPTAQSFRFMDSLEQPLQFPGNRIPASRFDQGGPRALNLFPLPNTTDPTNTFNTLFQATPLRAYEQMLRFDYNFGSKTHHVCLGTKGSDVNHGGFKSSAGFSSSSGHKLDIKHIANEDFRIGLITPSPALVRIRSRKVQGSSHRITPNSSGDPRIPPERPA